MIAISADSQADSRELARRLKLRFPLLSDPELRVISAYGLAMTGQDIAVPATLIVDPKGEIIFRHVGETMVDRPALLDILAQVPAKSAP